MTLLLVDDDPDILLTARMVLENAFPSWRVDTATDGLKALERTMRGDVRLVISDLSMPNMDGAALLANLKAHTSVPMVVLSASNDVRLALELVREGGAADYIQKPFKQEELIQRIRTVMETIELRAELEKAKEQLAQHAPLRTIIHSAPSMRWVLKRAEAASRTDAPVLITGESGTGKELVARFIHTSSPRSRAPFIAVNCGALPETLLEGELFGYRKGAFTGAVRDYPGMFMEAHRGTLFLDEIGETSLQFQVKLLRVLQEHEIRAIGDGKTTQVDVRVIAATNKDLQELVKQGTFREDLFYRLNVVPLHLPPLRERREDIQALTCLFLSRYAGEAQQPPTITPAAIRKLSRYHWPGNVRELENKIRQLIILTPKPELDADDIELVGDEKEIMSMPTSGEYRAAKQQVLAQFEQQYLKALLKRHDGNLTQAAKEAEMDRKNLWMLLKKYHINVHLFRGSAASNT